MPRKPRLIRIDTVTKSLKEWCKHYNIPAPVVLGRVGNGWSWRTALTTPRREYNNRERRDAED